MHDRGFPPLDVEPPTALPSFVDGHVVLPLILLVTLGSACRERQFLVFTFSLVTSVVTWLAAYPGIGDRLWFR